MGSNMRRAGLKDDAEGLLCSELDSEEEQDQDDQDSNGQFYLPPLSPPLPSPSSLPFRLAVVNSIHDNVGQKGKKY